MCIEEDWWRHQCKDYGTTHASKDDYKPPEGDERTEAAPTARATLGSRREAAMLEAVVLTELTSHARRGHWKPRALSSAGVVTAGLICGDDAVGVGQAITEHLATLEARQVKRDDSTVKAAKRFAFRSVEWYEHNPGWVPQFVHSTKTKAGSNLAESHSYGRGTKRTRAGDEVLDEPEEGISPTRGEPYVFPPFHSGTHSGGTLW